ncbi:tripartite tricarboxylate transporter TctB family protein [Xanthobacter pseudotagetidis]|uniref:tripartite tricarboxylate transporter TctB family protein n=1 Tax=Xanthobacter pseudotagetidis TaxID=3119911 RepID=UPI003726E949
MTALAMKSRVSAALPYVLLVVIAVVLWRLADHIEVAARPGQLGPDFWPKVAIGLMGIVALVELVRAIVSPNHREAHGIADQLEAAEPLADADELEDRSLPLLLGGMAMCGTYALSLGIIGFPLATFFFLAGFMYLGRFRRHTMIWISAFIGTAVLSVLFLKVVYVSLPRGMPPFDMVTDFIVSLH